jgi:riboflavin synthase alpha subunit
MLAITRNACTVRCRNNVLAGPFGVCLAVQQADATPSVNKVNTVETTQSLAAVDNQIAENQVDLPVAVAANQKAGSGEAVQGLAAVDGMFFHFHSPIRFLCKKRC